MKKFIGLVFAAAMILSLAFIGEIASSENPFAAKAQTSVRRKRSGNVVTRSGKYIYRKGRNGVTYVYRKTKNGTVYVGRKGYQGGKYVAGKGVQGTKYVGKKTVGGAKSIFNKTKKAID